ncbi:uncharacterized protein LOC113865430 isoform X2 [Abrus precatorius]|uniref:Uncharacterized protein LOC113865430 isoform X2 n=1 Tax=Abrus precatorius TaxID=3816 RepID=A0A8B8LI56_ABRPR|nr:uncharacterized protein LOC113865430 isoform X2 [Abrus precatorius]
MESSSKRKSGGNGEILDGSNIMELVGNEQVFSNFVDHKFHQLDKDRDGKLSVKELEPAVADIGAALGLPAQGISPDSDHIYFEVLNEFTHGKQEKVSKTEFKEVLSDILLGMAAGLKRDPIVILRMDGEDLLEFVNGPGYEAELASIFSQIESPSGSLREHVIEAFGRLTVDQGIPPTSDSWTLNLALENLLKDHNGKISKDHLRLALDLVSPSAGLPPVGAIEEMDKVIGEAFKTVNADDGKTVKEDEFKKIITEILGSIMLQLEGNPISVSSNSVVHEPLGSSSTLLQPSSSETA